MKPINSILHATPLAIGPFANKDAMKLKPLFVAFLLRYLFLAVEWQVLASRTGYRRDGLRERQMGREGA